MPSATYIPATGGSHADALRRPLMYSAVAHVALAVAALAATLIRGVSDMWGSPGAGGGAASVRLVASVPLPAPDVSTQNKFATEEKALNYRQAPPKVDRTPTPKKADPEAIELPTATARKVEPKKQPEKAKEEPPKQRQPLASTGPGQPTQTAMRRTPANANPLGAIPNGDGGPVSGPYGAIQAANGSGGVGMSGDFGDRFGLYVSAVRQRISNNWLQASIEPAIRTAPRALVKFRILRDGRIEDVELAESSRISSLDRSVLRAVYDSSPLQPLPPAYSGSSVDASFWFELKR